jgi:putative tricarboxylic transport membrane protein
VDVIATPGSAVVEHARTGKLRVLAISSKQRLPGRLAQVPTWTELGVPAVGGNTRIVVGPEGMSEAQVRYWDGAFAKLTQQDEWKKEADKRVLENTYMTAAQTRTGLDNLYKELSVLLRDLGLAK